MKALELESQGKITIVDVNQQDTLDYHERELEWKSNYVDLRLKAPQVDSSKLFEYYPSPYLIEMCLSETSPHHWKYLRGVALSGTISDDSVEYVYILTNKGYPGLLKIGMTSKSPQVRLKGINSTGTVDTWQLAFSIPLRPGTGYKVENQVHKYFNRYRFHAETEYDREMFRIDLPQAIEAVRRIGEHFRVGELNFYS